MAAALIRHRIRHVEAAQGHFQNLLSSNPVRRFSPCCLATFLKGTIFIVFKGYGIKERSQFSNPRVQVTGFLHST
jgi:hypothetical protein